MITPPHILKLLRAARATAIDEAVAAANKGEPPRVKVNWEVRRDYVQRVLLNFDALAEEAGGKVVFVSYSKATGAEPFGYLSSLLDQRKFEVATGFQAHREGKGRVLRQILGQLSRCAVYVAIMTKELEVRASSGDPSWAPSVWIVQEIGMALALRKPFVLMIDQAIHEDYWRKVLPDRLHHMFEESTLKAVTENVVEEIEDRYSEAALRHTSTPHRT
jgi:hypothetical protein